MHKANYKPAANAVMLRVRNIGEKYDLSDYAVRTIADRAGAWVKLPGGRRIDVAKFGEYVEGCRVPAKDFNEE